MLTARLHALLIAGIVGPAALREAAAGEMRAELTAHIDRVRAALDAKLNSPLPDAQRRWIDLEAVFADRVITCRDGKYWCYPYSQDKDGNITLADPTEVVEDYKPVAVKEAVMGAGMLLLEAADDSGRKYLIRVICAGRSGNNNYYPDAVLKEAVPLFNGVRVFVKSDEEHIAGRGKAFTNLIGRLSEAKFIAGKSPDTGEVQAVLELIDSADATAVKLREAVSHDMHDLFGFSIHATAKIKKEVREGKNVTVATKFLKVASVDLIVEPGAGGGVVRLVEAADDQPTEESAMLKTQLFELLKTKHPKAVDGKTIDDFTEAQLLEALGAKLDEVLTRDHAKAAVAEFVTREELALTEAKAAARLRIAESTLPAKAKERLRAQVDTATTVLAEAAVDSLIKTERDYIGTLTESGRVSMGGMDVSIVEGQDVKVGDMLDAFFDPAHKQHRNVRSFKECYIAITGDRRVTGQLADCDRARMSESLGSLSEALDSTSLPYVLGSAITRRMVAEYRAGAIYDGWRQICNVVPINDFRTQERTRMGGYLDLSTVAENDPYPAMTSPTDEKATYAAAKRGGTESVTREMIKNDDVGAIQRIPVKIARVAKRTLSKFVFDFVRTNPTLYDSVAFFHATHGNLATAALDATSLAARRLAMLKQAELSSAERLGIGPKFLVVPVDLEGTAVDLFNRTTNNDKSFVNDLSLTVIPVWYWTDTNDWALAADPMDIPGIEIGFVDGQEEPQILVQDNPTSGSMFTHDTMTFRVRHEYGGDVTEYRGWDKSVVA